MTTPYQREAAHERDILENYKKAGWQGTRSAGSHGIADIVVWNSNEIVFVCSQSVEWDIRKEELCWRSLKRPPNSSLLFMTLTSVVNGDGLASIHKWDTTPVTTELLEYAKKKKWDWVKCIR